MRKLKLQVQMSVDGFIAGSNGEMDWMTFDWDDDLKKEIDEITGQVDCIVLGRKLAQGFIPHWAAVAANPADPEFTAGKKFTDTHKVVFTKTLDKSEWENTTLAKGDLTEEIAKLKSQPGNDIIAYGGSTFVSSLIKSDLIDELHLFVNPLPSERDWQYSKNWTARANLCSNRQESFHAELFLSSTAEQPNLPFRTLRVLAECGNSERVILTAAEQGAAPDRLQPALVPRFGFQRRVSLVVMQLIIFVNSQREKRTHDDHGKLSLREDCLLH